MTDHVKADRPAKAGERVYNLFPILITSKSVIKGEGRCLDAWILSTRCAPTAAVAVKTGATVKNLARVVAVQGA